MPLHFLLMRLGSKQAGAQAHPECLGHAVPLPSVGSHSIESVLCCFVVFLLFLFNPSSSINCFLLNADTAKIVKHCCCLWVREHFHNSPHLPHVRSGVSCLLPKNILCCSPLFCPWTASSPPADPTLQMELYLGLWDYSGCQGRFLHTYLQVTACL